MQIRVTFRHTRPTEALKQYASEKVDRLAKFLIKPTSADVVLSVEKNRHKAEVLVHAIGGDVIKAAEQSEDMYAAIDLVVDKLQRQAKKIKAKVKTSSRHIATRHRVIAPVPIVVDERNPDITASEMMSAPPLTIEEGMLELRAHNRDFVVFTNRSTATVNIVYRRYDGLFGLIQPDLHNPEAANGGTIPFRFEVYSMDDEDRSGDTARMQRHKDVSVLPMSVEDSLRQLDDSRNDFWVFADENKRYVNVVYRLPDEEFGLIEAFASAG